MERHRDEEIHRRLCREGNKGRFCWCDSFIALSKENARAKFSSLGSSRRVVAESVRIVHFALDLVAILLAFGSKTVLPIGEAPRREMLKIGSSGRI